MSDAVLRRQMSLSRNLAFAIALTYVAVAFASRSEAIAAHILHRQEDRWERTNGLYQEHVGFLDAEDKILLRDLTLAEFSKGGVYLLGSSTMQHAAIPWHWPAEINAHLWAIKSANYKEQFQFVRFLTESEGWLAAGDEKTTVILGLSHLDARMKLPGTVDADFVPALFARHDLYRYDRDTGMSRQPVSLTVFHARRERLTLYQFLKSTWNEYFTSSQPIHQRRQGTIDDDAKAREFLARQLGGDDWRAAQDFQIDQLSKMIDYLKERQARIGAVLLPIKSWNDQQPFAAEFSRRVIELCQSKKVALLDISRVVPDAEFYDDTHLSLRGQKAIDPRIREFVERVMKR